MQHDYGHDPRSGSAKLSRRSVLRGAGVVATAALLAGTSATAACAREPDNDRLFAELDAKVEELMARYAVPGVAIGVWHQGREHLRGFGVTDIDAPEPVSADTLFRIGSTTKTATGTAVMRLVESGRVGLDERVRTYLPDFATADPTVAERVTVRQLLNHTPGWNGDFFIDFGSGDDALDKYVAEIRTLAQLTPLGTTFSYNNAAIVVAGHLVAKVTGRTYEHALRELVLDPLGLEHTAFDAVGPIAVPHGVVEGKAVPNPSAWDMPRSLHPTGGLISSARDQLSYARFHLGDGHGPDGTELLRPDSLVAMRSDPGPGGTLGVELDGLGVTWHLRPTAEGVHVVQHGGSWSGQHSGFLFVPDRDFAFTVLTNSDGGALLTTDLVYDDWVLQHFAGLQNLPAAPRDLSAAELAPYEGRYTAVEIAPDGDVVSTDTVLTAAAGRLRYEVPSMAEAPLGMPAYLAFYRDDHVLMLGRDGNLMPGRADFVRDDAGSLQWLRMGGRLQRKVA